MSKITYIEHNNKNHTIEVPNGLSVMEGAVQNNIKGIDADCGGSCACATCHVYVVKGIESLVEPSEDEDDYLDKAWGLKPNSRLSCQAIINGKDLTIEIPKYTINHASENR